MILDNYYRILNSVIATKWVHLPIMGDGNALSASVASSVPNGNAVRLCLTTTSGNNGAVGLNLSNVVTKYTNYSGIFFGNGTVEPKKTDYWLSGNWIKTLTSALVSCNITAADDGSCVGSATFNLTNTGTETVTISEAAMMMCLYSNGSQSGMTMVARMLLPDPVIIEAGSLGQVTVSITIPKFCN